MNNYRAKRLNDFAERARTDPGALFEVAELGAYVAVNPTADDTSLLLSLGITPESCTKVDCYWKQGGDVYLLQVESHRHAARKSGLWARSSSGEPPYVNLVGVVREAFVVRDTLHKVMRAFLPSLIVGLNVGESLTTLGDLEE